MRTGGFPSRDEVLRDILRRGRVSRRALLLSALGCFTAGAVAGYLARWLWIEEPREDARFTAPPTDDPELLWARGLAEGPIEALVDGQLMFAGAVDRFPSDSILWKGVEKLALYALQHESETGQRIRRRLLALRTDCRPPQHLELLFEQLARAPSGRRK